MAGAGGEVDSEADSDECPSERKAGHYRAKTACAGTAPAGRSCWSESWTEPTRRASTDFNRVVPMPTRRPSRVYSWQTQTQTQAQTLSQTLS